VQMAESIRCALLGPWLIFIACGMIQAQQSANRFWVCF
jgi:hypothetical protein